mmetsp:Transcript_11216/g.35604  ORF Transcript_11216/g.35604 Transcript_11216/m.35604 type:complete len:301 (-) Transcript_11216:481-1383(-)
MMIVIVVVHGAQHARGIQYFVRCLVPERLRRALALTLSPRSVHGAHLRTHDVPAPPELLRKRLNFVSERKNRRVGSVVLSKVVIPRSANRLVDVPMRRRVELARHGHPVRFLDRHRVLLAPRRLDVVHVTVYFVVPRQEGCGIVVPGGAKQAVRVVDIRKKRRPCHGRNERPASCRHCVQLVVWRGVAEPVVGKDQRRPPRRRIVECGLQREVPVRDRDFRIDRLERLLVLQSERHVRGDESGPLMPMVAVGGAAVVEVDAVVVVLRAILASVQPQSNLGRHTLHDHGGLEEGLPVAVAQ